MSTLRALTVIETLGAGGAERALVALLPALAAHGVAAEVAVLTDPTTLAPELEAAGVPVHRLALRHRWDVDRGIRRTAALARPFDVVHGHLFFGGLYAAASLVVARGPARVVTFHNLGYDSFPADTAWRKARKALDGALMRRAVDRRLAVSTAVADHYRRHLRLGEVTVLPNGFDIDDLRRRAAGSRANLAAVGLDPDRPVLVAVGRLVPEKAHLDLLAAMVGVLDACPAAQLLVIGDGPLRSQVEAAIADRGLVGHVVLAGYLSPEEALPLVAASDLFVSASTHEGFPLAPAEAMAVGVPVVATAVGGVPELVGDAGVLVAPSRPDVLASAILDLLADAGRRAVLAEAGRRRVAEEFDVDRIAERLAAIYRETVAGGHR